jgi:hypothetical protein
MQHVWRMNPSNSHWETYKKGFDALAGAVLVGGLVQALLLSLKGTGDTGKLMEKSAEVLVDWLNSAEAHCPRPPVPAGLTGSNLEKFVAALIDLGNVRDAMVIQDEALRYLSQAKLVAGAFKD